MENIMGTPLEILGRYKAAVKRRFMQFVRQKSPVPVSVPENPDDAFRLGRLMGRQEGYGEGLVEGTGLGLDVGLETVDEMMSQPVIFGEPGSA